MANNIPHDGKVLVQIYVTPKVRALAKAKAILGGITLSAAVSEAIEQYAGSTSDGGSGCESQYTQQR